MITYRELHTMDEMEEVQDLQAKVWGRDSAVPPNQTSTAVENGGIVIGAYDGEQLVGFVYGFAGFKEGKTYLCSHMLAIEEEYRSKKIGETLKQKQRDVAIEIGYDLMTWTYDPLETRNAYLNLTKVKGISDTYIENRYGEMKDGLNKGLPSDRLEVHWHITSPHVAKNQLLAMENPVPVNKVTYNEAELPVFEKKDIAEERTESVYSLHVPTDFQGVKAKDSKLALDWRMKVRNEFQQLFQQGYAVVHLELHDTEAAYIFVKKDTLQLGGNNT